MLLAFFFFLNRTASATRRIGKLIAFQRRKKIVFLLSKNFKKTKSFSINSKWIDCTRPTRSLARSMANFFFFFIFQFNFYGGTSFSHFVSIPPRICKQTMPILMPFFCSARCGCDPVFVVPDRLYTSTAFCASQRYSLFTKKKKSGWLTLSAASLISSPQHSWRACSGYYVGWLKKKENSMQTK